MGDGMGAGEVEVGGVGEFVCKIWAEAVDVSGQSGSEFDWFAGAKCGYRLSKADQKTGEGALKALAAVSANCLSEALLTDWGLNKTRSSSMSSEVVGLISSIP